MLMARDDMARSWSSRSLLYLIFAAPPLYVLSFLLAWRAGLLAYHALLWAGAWIAIGAIGYSGRAARANHPPGQDIQWLRVVHGATALCLLCGFLLLHLLNHAAALWSVGLHGSVMRQLRLWYRSDGVEPGLFALLLVMIATGVPMVVHHSRRRADGFRTIQMATGVYIGLFLCAHLLAILGSRNLGVKTDWTFAVGPAGLLHGGGMLIPYYLLGIFFLGLHVACGVRILLLHHGVAEAAARRAMFVLSGVALVTTALIAVAAFGFHIERS